MYAPLSNVYMYELDSMRLSVWKSIMGKKYEDILDY